MQVGQTVYCTKHALTNGIAEHTVHKVYDDAIKVGTTWSEFRYPGKNVFETRAEAVAAAEKMRLRKIESVRKSLAKFEKMRFRE